MKIRTAFLVGFLVATLFCSGCGGTGGIIGAGITSQLGNLGLASAMSAGAKKFQKKPVDLVVNQEKADIMLAPGVTKIPHGIDAVTIKMSEGYSNDRPLFVKAFTGEGIRIEDNFPAPVLSLFIEQDDKNRGIRVSSTLSTRDGELLSIVQDFYGNRSDEWIAKSVAQQYRKAVAIEPRAPTSAVAAGPASAVAN